MTSSAVEIRRSTRQHSSLLFGRSEASISNVEKNSIKTSGLKTLDYYKLHG